MIKTCPHCNKDFETNSKKKRFCCKECRIKYFNHLPQVKQFDNISELTENVDYIIDIWNGLPCVRLYGEWFKQHHPDRTLDEYKKEFPDAPLQSENDKMNTSKNSGLFMKTEKYKKIYSEKFKGESNPRHHSKISEYEIRRCSPFCDEFYNYRELSLSEKQKFIDSIDIPNEKRNTKIEYYINKGLSDFDASLALSERQRTFTMNKCIAKYGKEEGIRRYTERQENWSNNMERKYKLGEYCRYPKALRSSWKSNEELDFIKSLNDYLNVSDSVSALSNCHQFSIFDKENGKRYYFDYKHKNKLIEYNGDFFHANPIKYNADDIIINCKTASMIWKHDEEKIELAKRNGYDVLVVWSSEWLNDKQSVLEKCKKFIYEEY